MKAELNDIIKKLSYAQDLIHQGRVADANTAIYEAECLARFVRDNKAS
jgi:hypothetical protein